MLELKKLSQKDIKPKGWLKRQLELQAKGLSGNIEKYFADLSLDSAWLGGTGEAWERGPYYLDGLVSLAFLLNDKELIKKVYRWVDAILGSKNNDVGFGPLRNNDYWPRMVVQKALIGFYRATNDNRVVDFLLNYYKFMLKNIDTYPPYFWASARALEGMEAMLEVYEITKDECIPTLIERLKFYSFDWWSYFSTFKYPKPMSRYTLRPIFKLGKAIAEPIDGLVRASQKIPKQKSKKQILKFNESKFVKLIMFTHGVNIAMAYKYPVYYGYFKKDEQMMDISFKGYQNIMKYHGLAIGLHSSDEHIMGSDASSGVELCTITEQCYSFEEALRLTQNLFYADMVEYYIFNALPATFSQDMTVHQYVQQPNQIAADRKPRQFFDTNLEANIFGIAPNFGCCAANMHQGFPKFAENLAYIGEKGLYLLMYSPCEIKTIYNGEEIILKEITDYPFNDTVKIEIEKAVNLPLTLRIPSFAKDLSLNDIGIDIKNHQLVTITVNSGDKIELFFNDKLSIMKNADKSISIRKNNLLFAMPLNFEEKYVRGERPFHYREYISKAPFNFSPITTNGKLEIISEKSEMSTAIPFDRENKSLEYIVKAKRVKNWRKAYNSAQSPPQKPIAGERTNISLVPYGSTYLRIAQFANFENEVNK